MRPRTVAMIANVKSPMSPSPHRTVTSVKPDSCDEGCTQAVGAVGGGTTRDVCAPVLTLLCSLLAVCSGAMEWRIGNTLPACYVTIFVTAAHRLIAAKREEIERPMLSRASVLIDNAPRINDGAFLGEIRTAPCLGLWGSCE